MTNDKTPRMRTVPEAVKMLRELDAESAVTVRAVRRFVAEGRLPVTRVGSKALVNFDALLRLLDCPVAPVPEPVSGSIRRVDERRAHHG